MQYIMRFKKNYCCDFWARNYWVPIFTQLRFVFRPDSSKPKVSKQRHPAMKLYTENLEGRGHRNVSQPHLETREREIIDLFIHSFMKHLLISRKLTLFRLLILRHELFGLLSFEIVEDNSPLSWDYSPFVQPCVGTMIFTQDTGGSKTGFLLPMGFLLPGPREALLMPLAFPRWLEPKSNSNRAVQ